MAKTKVVALKKSTTLYFKLFSFKLVALFAAASVAAMTANTYVEHRSAHLHSGCKGQLAQQD